MCTGYASVDVAKALREMEKGPRLVPPPQLPAPSAVPKAVRAFLKKTPVAGMPAAAEIKNVSLLVDDFSAIESAGPLIGTVYNEFYPSDAIEIESTAGRQTAEAIFYKHVLMAIRPLPMTRLDVAYNFARSMAAYMLLNDLLANDATVPRAGCVKAAEVQLSDIPGIQGEIRTAMQTVPMPDAAAESVALNAYVAFLSTKEAMANKLTQETAKALGSKPDVAFIYRDLVPNAGVEFDVVRLSRGRIRTYAMLFMAGGKGSLSSPALCNVGNKSCGGYYVWP
jgi:hypothetical protein